MPVAVAESESFEAVGRVTRTKAFLVHRPGRQQCAGARARLRWRPTAEAVSRRFSAGAGDYLIADSAWLALCASLASTCWALGR